MSDLHEVALRIRHDLGKYATLQARWLPPDASAEERREAVRTDLLCTRRGPGGVRDAGAIAEALCTELAARGVDPESPIHRALQELVEAVTVLRAVSDRATDPAADAAVDRGRAAAEAVRRTARDFVDATRPPEPDSP